MSQFVPNPYHSPSESRRNSGAAALKLAEQLNPLVAQGERVFGVPIGIVKAVANLMRGAHAEGEEGWTATIRRASPPEDPAKVATLVLRGPDDWTPDAPDAP